MAILATLKDAYADYAAGQTDLAERVRGVYGAGRFTMDMAKSPATQMFSADQISGKRKGMAQPVQISEIQRGGFTIRTSRATLPLTPTFGDTVFRAITWNIHEVEFSVIDDEFRGNAVSEEQYIATLMMDADMALMNAIDAESATAIDAAKSVFTNAKLEYPFNVDQFEVVTPATMTNPTERYTYWSQFLLSADSVIAADGHKQTGSNRYIVGSPNMKTLVNNAAQYGGNNQFNLAPVWNGAIPYVSTNITEGAGTPVERANAYWMLPKSIETHTWISGDAKEGRVDYDQEKLTVDYSPVLDADVEFLLKQGLGDYSTRNGLFTRVHGKTMVRTIETAQITAYNSLPASSSNRHYGVSFQVGV